MDGKPGDLTDRITESLAAEISLIMAVKEAQAPMRLPAWPKAMLAKIQRLQRGQLTVEEAEGLCAAVGRDGTYRWIASHELGVVFVVAQARAWKHAWHLIGWRCERCKSTMVKVRGNWERPGHIQQVDMFCAVCGIYDFEEVEG